MAFRITGLDPEQFAALHALPDGALRDIGAQRVRIERAHAAPCRISLDDAPPGERVLLVRYEHQPAATPYRQHGPIFVRAGQRRFEGVDVIPPALRRRVLSLRGYDAQGFMIEAELVDGGAAEALIARLFANADVAEIHAHYARRGCFAARIARA